MSERVINVAQVDQIATTVVGDKVRVKLRRGSVEVEIESPLDRVGEVVAKVVEGLSSVGGDDHGMGSTARGSRQPIAPRKQGSATCRDLAEELWGEGWFSDPRGLADVVAELSRRGYNYNSTAVSHSLADLVREGVLTRLGTPRTYRYVQKKPPSPSPSPSVP